MENGLGLPITLKLGWISIPIPKSITIHSRPLTESLTRSLLVQINGTTSFLRPAASLLLASVRVRVKIGVRSTVRIRVGVVIRSGLAASKCCG